MVQKKRGTKNKATLKKMFVSCPAGGRNCGQLGGRNIFFLSCKKILKFLTKKIKKIKNDKKKVPILQLYPHLAAGPETTFFLRVA